jgi:flagellar motility protein MotE (MotC chaperone)
MKQFIQATAGRFGYFILKRATLDRLTTELAEARERIKELEAKLQDRIPNQQDHVSKLQDKIAAEAQLRQIVGISGVHRDTQTR